MEDFQNKECLKKAFQCFKKAGTDLSKIPDTSNQTLIKLNLN